MRRHIICKDKNGESQVVIFVDNISSVRKELSSQSVVTTVGGHEYVINRPVDEVMKEIEEVMRPVDEVMKAIDEA